MPRRCRPELPWLALYTCTCMTMQERLNVLWLSGLWTNNHSTFAGSGPPRQARCLTGRGIVRRTRHVSSTAVQVSQASPRRHLSARQAQTVERLTEAAVDELVDVGYSALTVR